MGKLNLDKIKEKKSELEKVGNGGNYEFDRLKDGKNVRRILPPKGSSDLFYSEGFLHFGLGDDGKTAVTCLETFDKKCPICEYIESIKSSKNKEDIEFAKNSRKVSRIYLNVLNRDSDEDEEKPVVLPVGKSILKQVIEIICDPDYGDITDFEEGRDITITRKGKGLNTEYSVISKPKTSVASEFMDEDELDESMVDLDTLFSEKSYDELSAILRGEEYESDGGDDDDLDYDEMSLGELKKLCKERGIQIPSKAKKDTLIDLLIDFDGDNDEDYEDEDDEDYDEDDDEDYDEDGEEDYDEDDDEDEDDDLMNSVKNAVKNRKNKSANK